jgi:hypothetical protein
MFLHVRITSHYELRGTKFTLLPMHIKFPPEQHLAYYFVRNLLLVTLVKKATTYRKIECLSINTFSG